MRMSRKAKSLIRDTRPVIGRLHITLGSMDKTPNATIVIREGDKASELAHKFSLEYQLATDQVKKLEKNIQATINDVERNTSPYSKFDNSKPSPKIWKQGGSSSGEPDEYDDASSIKTFSDFGSPIVQDIKNGTFSSHHHQLPLFNLEIEVREGRSEKIIIYENDNAREVAEAFCAYYELEDSIVQKLEELIEKNMLAHQERT